MTAVTRGSERTVRWQLTPRRELSAPDAFRAATWSSLWHAKIVVELNWSRLYESTSRVIKKYGGRDGRERHGTERLYVQRILLYADFSPSIILTFVSRKPIENERAYFGVIWISYQTC